MPERHRCRAGRDMKHGVVTAALALALCSADGSACAMSGSAVGTAGCRVIGAGHLPPDSGGADALCETVRQSIAAAGTVEIRVRSPHLMEATVTLADGRRLPAVKTARSDQPLNRRSFQMLADALAAQLARVQPTAPGRPSSD
jgi:hypothetical protein